MGEKQLVAAIETARVRAHSLQKRIEESEDRGEKQRLAHQRVRAAITYEALQYALALIRGEEKE